MGRCCFAGRGGRWSAALAALVCAFTAPAWAAEPPQSPGLSLRQFNEKWDESAWLPKPPSRPPSYLRPLDDTGWKSRLRARQALIAAGDDAIPVLIEALRSTETPARILAAETLGYLGAEVPVKDLLEAAASDSEPAVRLYAVDALGMLGHGVELEAELKSLDGNERNRDVKRHIAYALERNSEPVPAELVKTVAEWNVNQMDTAAVGQPAPDFALESLTGATFSLSRFRGHNHVVLIFIYGDT